MYLKVLRSGYMMRLPPVLRTLRDTRSLIPARSSDLGFTFNIPVYERKIKNKEINTNNFSTFKFSIESTGSIIFKLYNVHIIPDDYIRDLKVFISLTTTFYFNLPLSGLHAQNRGNACILK